MREIKFRAWSVDRQCYEYDVGIYGGKPARHGYQWFSVDNDVFNSDSEQYTGLKDKNGKEIYEGDIVDNCNGIVEIKYYNNLNFDSGGGVHSGFYYSDEVEYYDKGSKYWEVIGNIHENPELLNA